MRLPIHRGAGIDRQRDDVQQDGEGKEGLTDFGQRPTILRISANHQD